MRVILFTLTLLIGLIAVTLPGPRRQGKRLADVKPPSLVDKIVPPGQCAGSGCAVWLKNCELAANNAYFMCRTAGGSPSCCLDDYAWMYNSCMAGTGCPYTPYSTDNCVP